VADPAVAVLDLAVPPDAQLAIVREAVAHAGHIRGILAQKPLGMNLAEATEVVDLCDAAGITLSVNQNMRYDQSIRTLKHFLGNGHLGEPVVAQIDMHVRLDWQPYAADYARKAMLIMSIHHLDAFRFLFGDPERILVSTRPDAPADARATDQVAISILEYAGGLRAVAVDNCFSWADKHIAWRVDGTDGIAKGTIGWPDHPWGSPSRFDFVPRDAPDEWYRPRWGDRWFPGAFGATMGQLLRAIAQGEEPEISAADNLRTMALLDAAYTSAAERRAVTIDEATVSFETSKAKGQTRP
jgi:predicted dehydrogenase